MAIYYEKGMKLVGYKSGEIEIVDDEKYYFYFRNKQEFISLLKSNPELMKEIIEEIGQEYTNGKNKEVW